MSRQQPGEGAPFFDTQPRPRSERLRRGLGKVGAVAAAGVIGYGGGIMGADISPAEVTVGTAYQAEVSLSAAPTDTSSIRLMTTGGSLDVQFDSWVPIAPGIKVTPMLSDRSLELSGTKGFSVDSLIPSDQEIRQAVTSAAEQLALRFGIGTVSAEVLLLAGLSLYRRDRPDKRQLLAAGVAGLLAFGGVAGQTIEHYQPENYSTFTADGLLARVYNNRTLLDDIQTRSRQMEPFVTSLLSLSTELQQKFVTPESNQPAAAKFLLVSDIHGVDQYAMLKKIIGEEGITAVIDSGDLINFGRPQEIDALGFDKAIADLGVPYLFVLGNHDSDNPHHRDLLDRLAQIKNVVLLQPSSDQYAVATINGITVAGFNDPRYYGDEDKNNDQKEQPAIDSFNRSFADEPTPDIVVTHEPYAAEKVKKAGLTDNGHTHQAGLKENHIQVGSFTGGGLFHHVPDSEAGVSRDQPYAFDILTIDDTCTPQSLTRFSFQSIIQGEPQYNQHVRYNQQKE